MKVGGRAIYTMFIMYTTPFQYIVCSDSVKKEWSSSTLQFNSVFTKEWRKKRIRENDSTTLRVC
jgi:hypothetical protein